MKKVACYARVSTLDQNIESQLVALRDYCNRMNYKHVEEFIDTGSGKDINRPQFEQMLNGVRAGKFDCIITYKIDRFARSLKHLLNLFEEFQNRKVDFVSITQPIDTTTAAGKMFWQILGVFSEFERSLIIERTKMGLARAKRQGKKLGRPTGSKDTKRRRKSGYIARYAKTK